MQDAKQEAKQAQTKDASGEALGIVSCRAVTLPGEKKRVACPTDLQVCSDDDAIDLQPVSEIDALLESLAVPGKKSKPHAPAGTVHR